MIQRIPEITDVRIVRSAQPWDQHGVIGFATVRFDGIVIGPIFLVRDLDGEVEQYFGECVLAKDTVVASLGMEVRDRIWFAISDLVDERDAGVPEE